MLQLDLPCSSTNYTLALNKQQMDIAECEHQECLTAPSETDLLLEEQNQVLNTYQSNIMYNESIVSNEFYKKD